MKINMWLIALTFTIAIIAGSEGCIYVSPSGSSVSGNGTLANPFATIMDAFSSAQNQQVVNVCLLSGLYVGENNTNFYFANPTHLPYFQKVNIQGQGSVGFGKGQVVINNASFSMNNVDASALSLNFLSSNVTLTTIQFSFLSSSGGNIAYFQNTSCSNNCYVTVDKGQLTINGMNISNTNTSNAFFFLQNDETIITLLQVSNCTGQQLVLSSNDNTQISNSIFRNNVFSDNIFAFLGANAVFSNCQFIRNHFPLIDHLIFASNSLTVDSSYFSCNSAGSDTSAPSVSGTPLFASNISVDPTCPFAGCSGGRYQTSVLQTCQYCPVGTIVPAPIYTGNCTACPAGSAPSLTDFYSCSLCPAGFEKSADGAYCDPCMDNTFKPNPGVGQCLPCPVNEISYGTNCYAEGGGNIWKILLPVILVPVSCAVLFVIGFIIYRRRRAHHHHSVTEHKPLLH